MENLLCDFCSAKALAWCYPAASFIAMSMGPLVSSSEGGWAACDACHRLIAADDREGLAQRSLSTLIEAHPEMAAVRFFAHRCGDAIRVTPPEAAAAELTRSTAGEDSIIA
jgi:hypothetical protein